jgi:hypothetical protein
MQAASWGRNAAAAAILACAAYGVGSLLSPYLRKAWLRWRARSEDDVQTQLLKLLTVYTRRQDDTAEQLKEVTASMKQMQVRTGCPVSCVGDRRRL